MRFKEPHCRLAHQITLEHQAPICSVGGIKKKTRRRTEEAICGQWWAVKDSPPDLLRHSPTRSLEVDLGFRAQAQNVCHFIKAKTGRLLTLDWAGQLSPNRYSEQVPHCSSYIINLPQSMAAELRLHRFYTRGTKQAFTPVTGSWTEVVNEFLSWIFPTAAAVQHMLTALYKQCNGVWVQDDKSSFMRLKW